MSRNELIDAYRRGRISRRSFVKGMTAVGVSAVAATKMADDLRAAPAGPRGGQTVNRGDDTYETPAPTAAATQPPTSLPDTGAGGSGGSGASLLKPLAVAGAAAAAFVAAKYRKVRGAESE